MKFNLFVFFSLTEQNGISLLFEIINIYIVYSIDYVCDKVILSIHSNTSVLFIKTWFGKVVYPTEIECFLDLKWLKADVS